MKKAKFILIIFVIISIVFDFYTYKKQNYNASNTRLADQIFMENLSQARGGFAKDYSKMNENDKIYNYIEISSNLYTAMNTIDLTSYSKDSKARNELFVLIYNLYLCMTRSDSREEILTNNNRSIIYNCLSQIILNPKDEKDCLTVSKLAGDLYFNNAK